MRNIKVMFNSTLSGLLLIGLLSIGGCKQQQQMQQQMEGLEGKVTESQKRITALDSELKKSTFEVQQLKAHIIKLTNVVQELQKAEEERLKAAEVAKNKAKGNTAAAAKKPSVAAPKKR